MLRDKYRMLLELAIEGDDVHQELSFGALLEPKLRKVFYETYDEVPEQYKQVFHVQGSKKAKETDYGLGAMTPWAKFGDAATKITGEGVAMPEVPYEVIPAGLERTYTHEEFAKGFIVERKFADDEKYNIIEKMPKDLARAGRYKVETDAASLFNNAFTTNLYDGKPLIAGNHPMLKATAVSPQGFTGYNSNLLTGGLSDNNLKLGLTMGRRQCDEAGKLIQMKFDTLIVSPENEFYAYELIKSAQKVGTTDNDINSIQGRLKIIVLDFLTDADAWFMTDSKRHQLNFFWRVKPEFKREEDFNTLVQKYRGYMRYSFGASDYRGIIGSTGA